MVIAFCPNVCQALGKSIFPNMSDISNTYFCITVFVNTVYLGVSIILQTHPKL